MVSRLRPLFAAAAGLALSACAAPRPPGPLAAATAPVSLARSAAAVDSAAARNRTAAEQAAIAHAALRRALQLEGFAK